MGVDARWSGCAVVSPALAFRLGGTPPRYEGDPPRLAEGEGLLYGCSVVAVRPLTDEEVTEVRAGLADPSTYGDPSRGARCYFPGFAFRLGDGSEVEDVLVCLECHWVAFHTVESTQSRVPSEAGTRTLRTLYRRFVP